jgi:hypothetical protein
MLGYFSRYGAALKGFVLPVFQKTGQLELLAESRYYEEPLKTSVFSGFLTLWRKLHLRNSL